MGAIAVKTKVIVIGIDGGTWKIAKPLAAEGKLPAISRLMSSGCYGELESCIPPSTFTAWRCYSTGKNPGQFGVFSSLNVDVPAKKVIVNNSLSYKSEELWDYLGGEGIVCGILDMPTTYPPRRVNGFMVSQSFTEQPRFTYPPGLGAELKEKFNYKLTTEYLPVIDKDRAIEDTQKIINQRFDAAGYLLRKFAPRFFHMTVYDIDSLQHYYWKYMEENHPRYGTVIEDCWRLIDKRIGLLLDAFCDEETYVFLISDHGFAPVKGIFNLAHWLADRGYVAFNRGVLSRWAAKISAHVDVVAIVKTLGLFPFLRRVVPFKLQQKIYLTIPTKELQARADMVIDWDKSKIIPIGDGQYINTNLIPRDSEQYEQFRNNFINEMESITHPRTGEKQFSNVYRREEVFHGKYAESAPDVIGLNNEGYFWGIPLDAPEWDYPASWSAAHTRAGIFCVKGPDIRKNVAIKGVKIYDIAPTILHLFNIPSPQNFDGRILRDIFEPGTKPAKRQSLYREGSEEERVHD